MLLMMLMERIMSDPIHRRTMLTSWFEANQIFEDARELTYCDFSSKWRWDESSKIWIRRKRGEGKIGQIYYVHPSVGERYYLRMLLLIVKGACDYVIMPLTKLQAGQHQTNSDNSF
jgi:uncharacterized lipoprotein